MKKVAILPNIQKDKGLAVTKRLVRYLEEKGCQPRLSEAVAELAELPQYAQTETELYQNSDLLISLGGALAEKRRNLKSRFWVSIWGRSAF